jgi:hypothetical protein
MLRTATACSVVAGRALVGDAFGVELPATSALPQHHAAAAEQPAATAPCSASGAAA